ncbi:PQQ-binding-like beta-propeller repeat protein [Isoptericola halotolerans]|uniref:outer membrane protein assembly factor BamB family protein n=1 Tax=Isoptericola halotolerans TaxID=300560 RepID=UPI00388DD7BF
MVSFDITAEQDEHDDGTSPRPDPHSGWWQRGVDRWRRADRRQRRRVAGVAGGAALLLVGGAATTVALVSHAHDERLRAAPGGVLSLDGELAEVWRADDVRGISAVLPDGGLVLMDGHAVVARDAASGTERWRADLGPDPSCGPTPRPDVSVEWAMPSELVTCLHGPADERTVTVLDAAGDVVGRRELPATEHGGEHHDVLPAADGGLLVVDHDTGMPAVRDHATESAARAVLEDVEPGEASVHVEDAVTGVVRFEVPTSPPAGALDECGFIWNLEESGWPGAFDPAAPYRVAIEFDRSLVSSPSVVSYQWCDVGGAASADGTSFTEHLEGSLTSAVSAVAPFPGGGHLVSDEHVPGGSVLLADDGSVLIDSPRTAIALPMAALEIDGGVVLATRPGRVVGLDADGSELWQRELPHARVVAQAGGTAVVHTDDDLVALDVQDGAERWRTTVRALERQELVQLGSAVTDGERIAVAVTRHATETSADELTGELITVDLGSGAVTQAPLPARSHLWAVDGHLVLLQQGASERPGEPGLLSVSTLAPR